jgi:hypothetical protein
MLSRFFLSLGIVLFIPLLMLNIWGQSNASRLDVVITDPSGGIVRAAQIELISTETAFAYTGSTNENGLYVFP